ncbi:hypothetical protein MHH52_08135 [Paenibacillus sp. FSL K6-0276]|uniref:hypothetical protein n=1 Tax=unclassified Paenibacillus TaxID=185978 RepID=UPI0028B05A08|nr:hypothetical protein [Paenibacillus sp.]
MFDDNNPNQFNRLPDPDAAKANFDVNQRKLHSEGSPGFWSEVSNLLIAVGIIAAIIILIRIF